MLSAIRVFQRLCKIFLVVPHVQNFGVDLATKYGDFLARLLLTFWHRNLIKPSEYCGLQYVYYFVYSRVCSSTSTDSTSLTRCGYPLGLYFYCICSLGAITLLVMLAMPSQRFGEKVIENSEKDKENTEDSVWRNGTKILRYFYSI